MTTDTSKIIMDNKLDPAAKPVKYRQGLRKPITSREYKLMLMVERFENRQQGIKDFWCMVKCMAQEQGGGNSRGESR